MLQIIRGQLSQLCPLPNSCLLAGMGMRAEWKREAALILCKHCWAIAQTLACFQHCFSHKHKTQHNFTAMKIVNLIQGQIQYTCKNVLGTKDSPLWNFKLMIMMTCLRYNTSDSLLICMPNSFLTIFWKKKKQHNKQETNGGIKKCKKSWQQIVYNWRSK